MSNVTRQEFLKFCSSPNATPLSLENISDIPKAWSIVMSFITNTDVGDKLSVSILQGDKEALDKCFNRASGSPKDTDLAIAGINLMFYSKRGRIPQFGIVSPDFVHTYFNTLLDSPRIQTETSGAILSFIGSVTEHAEDFIETWQHIMSETVAIPFDEYWKEESEND